MIRPAKIILVLCIVMFAFSVHSFAQQQGAKVKMTVTHTVESTDIIHEVIIAKYGNDEAKIGEAMNKIRKLKKAGKRVMTANEFAKWKQAVDTKMASLKTNVDKQKMRQLIATKTARIVILEDNI